MQSIRLRSMATAEGTTQDVCNNVAQTMNSPLLSDFLVIDLFFCNVKETK